MLRCPTQDGKKKLLTSLEGVLDAEEQSLREDGLDDLGLHTLRRITLPERKQSLVRQFLSLPSEERKNSGGWSLPGTSQRCLPLCRPAGGSRSRPCSAPRACAASCRRRHRRRLRRQLAAESWP